MIVRPVTLAALLVGIKKTPLFAGTEIAALAVPPLIFDVPGG
jgi:hypothetical protein